MSAFPHLLLPTPRQKTAKTASFFSLPVHLDSTDWKILERTYLTMANFAIISRRATWIKTSLRPQSEVIQGQRLATRKMMRLHATKVIVVIIVTWRSAVVIGLKICEYKSHYLDVAQTSLSFWYSSSFVIVVISKTGTFCVWETFQS